MGHCDACTVKSQMHRWPPGLSSRRALASAAFQSGIMVSAYEMLTCNVYNVPYHICRRVAQARIAALYSSMHHRPREGWDDLELIWRRCETLRKPKAISFSQHLKYSGLMQ